jgi:3-dehydroquinate dehydratase
LITPDALDIEASLLKRFVKVVSNLARDHHIAVVASAHDFHHTPSLADAQIPIAGNKVLGQMS